MNLLHPLDLLRQARIRYSQSELASLLGVDVRTIRRWEVRENDPPPYLADAIRQRILPLVSPKAVSNRPFTFIDQPFQGDFTSKIALFSNHRIDIFHYEHRI